MTYTNKIAKLYRRDPDLIFFNYMTQFYRQLEAVADFNSADELLEITTDLGTFNDVLDTLKDSDEKAQLKNFAGESDHHFKVVQIEARICLYRISEMERLKVSG